VDLLTTLAACSVAKDYTLVLAMAVAFSQGNVFTVKDAREIEAPPLYEPGMVDDQEAEQTPRTRDAAVAKLARLRDAGAVVAAGLLPVMPEWAAQFQRSVPDLFDPCINVSIASAMVSQFEYECDAKAGRACVLQRYATAAGLEGFDTLVIEAIRSHGLPAGPSAVIETEEVFSNPIYPTEPSKRDWGADKIFFTSAAGKGAERPHPSSPAKQAGGRK
jgi:hypothetical protein